MATVPDSPAWATEHARVSCPAAPGRRQEARPQAALDQGLVICATTRREFSGPADALTAELFGRAFPGLAEVKEAAGKFRTRKPWPRKGGPEGPRPQLVISPGMLAIEAPDPARAERTYHRDVSHRAHLTDQQGLSILGPSYYRPVEIGPDLMTPDLLPPIGRPAPRRVISEWSRDSRSNMWKVLGSLDYAPVTAGGRVTSLTTLTLPGNWEAVCPDGRVWKAMRDTLRKRYERAWGEPLAGIWKNEYQHRGAPHVAFAHAVPWGVAGQYRRAEYEAKLVAWEAAGRVGRRPYFRTAQGDGLQFRQWLSLVWTEIVFPPDPVIGPRRDPEERRKHLAAGTSVDVREGMRFQDPRRMMVYFAKHGQFRAKEYQNRIPEQWQAPGKTPGRFWGYWGLRPAVVRVELDPATDWDLLARTLRRWSAADYRSIPVTRQVQARRVDTRTGRVRTRKVRRRVRRMRGALGFMVVSDGPRLAAQLARVMEATG